MTTGPDIEVVKLTRAEAGQPIARALHSSGLTGSDTDYLVDGILDAEISGSEGQGLDWLPFYCEHLQSGKNNGSARPQVSKVSPVVFAVDTQHGFSHPAIRIGFRCLIPTAREHGLAMLTVRHAYNAGTLGWHTEFLAREGLLGLAFANSAPALAPPGGSTALLGTNPFSYAVPAGARNVAFLVDQSSSVVAKSAVRLAAAQGRPIPLGWAYDQRGNPTDDPNEALVGSVAPAGGYKGFNLALLVEVMAAAITGSQPGSEVGSSVKNDGRYVDTGASFIAINPDLVSNGLFAARIKDLTATVHAQPGTRLPNDRRKVAQSIGHQSGLAIRRELYDRILSLS